VFCKLGLTPTHDVSSQAAHLRFKQSPHRGRAASHASEHVSAASTVTAAACILGPHCGRSAAFRREPICDKQLLAGFDTRHCLNVDPSVGLHRLTVGDAGMVKPARAVAAKRTVNDSPIGKTKEERMALLPETAMSAYGMLPGHDRTGVFEDELPGAQRSQRKDAAAMDARAADRNSSHR